MGTNIHRLIDKIPLQVMASAKMAYSVGEKERHYHNWDHAMDVLGSVGSVQWDHPMEAVLAAIFHDAVYVAGATDNEAKSAELFLNTWKTFGISGYRTDLVAKMIHATAYHLDHLNSKIVNAPLEVLRFMDCDMAGLGLPFIKFNQASKKIEAEFLPVVGPDNFLHGRKRFWEKLANRPTIFHTSDFSSLEWQARKNIGAELQYLRQGISPSGISLL